MDVITNTIFELSQHDKAEIDAWVAQYPAEQKRSAVIPALHIAQKANGGWLSEAAMKAVADYLDLPQIQVFEVATFYSMFELAPVGKHKLCVCTNVSCMLSGSDEIVAHLKKRLQINFGETTADNKFTLKEVECLGACVNAPVLQLDHQFHEKLTPEKIDALLAGLE
ncbi:MAG: NADH-quinone oxidoreductase subunit [Gammaproteobacteria bacterium]|jgi:NADH-quinone oxidoreductase subunit E|nr:NADH-quinone oxidoreductase subunit [Gammaproteobacteria bacterium]